MPGFNMSEMFPSKYLKAEEFAENEERVRIIRDVTMATLGEGAKAEDKFILNFEDDKPLVLNKTNAAIIARLYGGHTEDWGGRTVQLFTMEVDAFGDIVRSIRVRSQVPREAPVARVSAPSAPPSAPAAGDDKPITVEQVETLKQLGRELWGADANVNATLRERLGNNPTIGVAKVQIDRLREALRQRELVAKQPAPANDPFADDEFDDSDPFADD